MMATKKSFKTCEGCSSPAKCKAAGTCMAKEGKGKPALAIMIGMPKKMAKGGAVKAPMAKKK